MEDRLATVIISNAARWIFLPHFTSGGVVSEGLGVYDLLTSESALLTINLDCSDEGICPSERLLLA